MGACWAFFLCSLVGMVVCIAYVDNAAMTGGVENKSGEVSPRNTLDIANPNLNAVDLFEGALGHLAYRRYTSKNGHRIQEITEGGAKIWDSLRYASVVHVCLNKDGQPELIYFVSYGEEASKYECFAKIYSSEGTDTSEVNGDSVGRMSAPLDTAHYEHHGDYDKPILIQVGDYYYITKSGSVEKEECVPEPKNGDWRAITPSEFNERLEKLQELAEAKLYGYIVDILKPRGHGLEILEQTQMTTIRPLQDAKIVKFVEGEFNIWGSSNGEVCLSASFFYKNKKALLADLTIMAEGMEEKKVYFERRIFGWYQITEALFNFKLEGFNTVKDGFTTASLYIAILAVISLSLA